MNQREDKKFYYMKTQRRIGKSGKAYHTGKFAYAVDLIGFEKEDGTITWWLSPKNMDEMKQQQDARGGQQGYRPNPAPQFTPSQPKQPQSQASNGWDAQEPWPNEHDEIPF